MSSRSEAAFTELVRRHVDFIYSAALRLVRDKHLAEDVTQGVFVALAKSASELAERAVLSGWLHRTAQNIAAQTVRTIERRRAREQEAVAMNELLFNQSEASWEAITPHLDAALGELNEADRDVLLLRYFERKSAAEMATTLGISNEAAQKRVSRAVERLREYFSKRKVEIGVSGLAALISANAVQSAPVGLTATISAAALLTGTAFTTSTAIGVTKTIAMTTIQKTLVTVTVAVLAGTGIYEARHVMHLRSRSPALLQPQSLQIPPTQPGSYDANAKINGLQDNPESGSNAVTSTHEALSTTTAVAAQETPPVIATNSQPGPELLKSSWTNAGFATPEAALKTHGWSVLSGDRELFAESLFITQGARKMIEDKLVQMASASTDPNRNQFIQEAVNNKWGAEEAMLMPMMALNQQQGFAGYRILSEQSPAAGQMVLDVETEMNSGPPQENVLKFQQFGTDWKIVIDEDSLK